VLPHGSVMKRKQTLKLQKGELTENSPCSQPKQSTATSAIKGATFSLSNKLKRCWGFYQKIESYSRGGSGRKPSPQKRTKATKKLDKTLHANGVNPGTPPKNVGSAQELPTLPRWRENERERQPSSTHTQGYPDRNRGKNNGKKERLN